MTSAIAAPRPVCTERPAGDLASALLVYVGKMVALVSVARSEIAPNLVWDIRQRDKSVFVEIGNAPIPQIIVADTDTICVGGDSAEGFG